MFKNISIRSLRQALLWTRRRSRQLSTDRQDPQLDENFQLSCLGSSFWGLPAKSRWCDSAD